MQSTKISSVIIDSEDFKALSVFLKKNLYDRIFILVDENTLEFCLPILLTEITLKNPITIKIQSGEANKNLRSCEEIWNQLTKNTASRKSLLINLGGGIISDMGGFAASCFKRGMEFINIPTTVLASVDASIGGKLGIDFQYLKNQIGIFNSPKAVFINKLFFKTLDIRQIKSGYAEIIKHALISDLNYWNLLRESNNLNELDWNLIIEKSIHIKNEIVLQDPFEESIRKVLNFGHTIGHALETYSLENDVRPLLHGEAVAIGMICEAYLSVKFNALSEIKLKEICTFINSVYLKYSIDHKSFEKLMIIMKQDKKNDSGFINFTLLKDIGKAEINFKIESKFILESLHYYNNLKTTNID